jgi:DNA-binding MarR family transcriptional regulator
LETRGYVRRTRSRDDRRRVFVSLLPRGERLLEQVAQNRISELRTSGEALVGAIEALLERGQHSDNNPKQTAKREVRDRRDRRRPKN